MVVYNAGARELTAKIVYYGPGLCGKTTNLQLLHDRLDPKTVGKLVTLSTQTDRTIYFDLLPVEMGEIKGYRIRFQLATVPGQTAFNETRKLVLRGADGVVFVADSRWEMLPKNLESWQNLKDNLKENGLSIETIPIVIQYNKRDLEDILSVEAMQEALGFSSYPFVEAVASAGRGITETFKLASKLTFVDLLRRLQGKKPEDAGLEPRTAPTLILVSPPTEPATPVEEHRSKPEEPKADPRIAELERRITEGEAQRLAGQQAVDAALASLSARVEKLFQEVASAGRDLRALESSLKEKTAQGLREAEDIRTQIAPLLEEREAGRESERRMLAELDRLRESLADSLALVSESLRRAVGGL